MLNYVVLALASCSIVSSAPAGMTHDQAMKMGIVRSDVHHMNTTRMITARQVPGLNATSITGDAAGAAAGAAGNATGTLAAPLGGAARGIGRRQIGDATGVIGGAPGVVGGASGAVGEVANAVGGTTGPVDGTVNSPAGLGGLPSDPTGAVGGLTGGATGVNQELLSGLLESLLGSQGMSGGPVGHKLKAEEMSQEEVVAMEEIDKTLMELLTELKAMGM